MPEYLRIEGLLHIRQYLGTEDSAGNKMHKGSSWSLQSSWRMMAINMMIICYKEINGIEKKRLGVKAVLGKGEEYNFFFFKCCQGMSHQDEIKARAYRRWGKENHVQR